MPEPAGTRPAGNEPAGNEPAVDQRSSCRRIIPACRGISPAGRSCPAWCCSITCWHLILPPHARSAAGAGQSSSLAAVLPGRDGRGARPASRTGRVGFACHRATAAGAARHLIRGARHELDRPARARQRRMLAIMIWIIRHLGWHTGAGAALSDHAVVLLPARPAPGPPRATISAGCSAARRAGATCCGTFHLRLRDPRPGVLPVPAAPRPTSCACRGCEAVTEMVNAGRGCILLGSHLGSFDVLRAFGRTAPVRVSPVMFRRNSGHLTRLLERLDPELARRRHRNRRPRRA